MHLHDHLREASKADLQRYYLYWCPSQEMTSSREKLQEDLLEAMQSPTVVRERFDGLKRSQRAFIVSLLLRGAYRGSVEDVLADRHGRTIEPFETEAILSALLADGLLMKEDGPHGANSEHVLIPKEIGDALRRTVSIEDREAIEMLSLRAAAKAARLNGGGLLGESISPQKALASLEDAELKALVEQALDTEHGILAYSSTGGNGVAPGRIDREDWRSHLEERGLGTTGVLNLKDYGIEFEQEAMVLYQEIVYEHALDAAREPCPEIDEEVCLGTDLLIDIDRMLELLRGERLEVTRDGRLYKKTEERIASAFITSGFEHIFSGSAVQYVLEVCRRLRFFDVEGQRIAGDPLRRRGWQKKSLLDKLQVLFDLSLDEQQGTRWSFHQKMLREILLEHLRTVTPGEWVQAQPLLTAIVASYLLRLEANSVREEFRKRCDDDFRNETLMVPFEKLHHDLSYWILHRLALLGLVDLGYRDETLKGIRLSSLGLRFFDQEGEAGDTAETRPALVNPDFEVLVFPGGSESDLANVALGRFADRLESERVKRYRLTRESVKRGIVSGMSGKEILDILKNYSRAEIPPNVAFSVREWTEGVETVRAQKVLLLRAVSPAGATRLVQSLEQHDIPCELLNSTTVMVRGTKNEKAVRDLRDELQGYGLYLE